MKRPKLPLHLPLRSAGTIILRITLSLSIAWLLWQSHKTQAVLEHAADQDSIAALSKRLSAAETHLDERGIEKPVSDADFRAAQQALSSRIDTLEASLQALKRGAAGLNDVVLLEMKLEHLSEDLQALHKAQSTPAPAAALPVKSGPPAPVPAKPLRINPAKVARKSQSRKKSPPPFNVIGLEYRGGERFLSVAPQGSTSLSDIYLVRPGDTVGSTRWRLNGIDGNRAQFVVDGTARSLSITQ